MNILANFQIILFAFIILVSRDSIVVLDLENRPGSESSKIRTGSRALGITIYAMNDLSLYSNNRDKFSHIQSLFSLVFTLKNFPFNISSNLQEAPAPPASSSFDSVLGSIDTKPKVSLSNISSEHYHLFLEDKKKLISSNILCVEIKTFCFNWFLLFIPIHSLTLFHVYCNPGCEGPSEQEQEPRPAGDTVFHLQAQVPSGAGQGAAEEGGGGEEATGSGSGYQEIQGRGRREQGR